MGEYPGVCYTVHGYMAHFQGDNSDKALYVHEAKQVSSSHAMQPLHMNRL